MKTTLTVETVVRLIVLISFVATACVGVVYLTLHHEVAEEVYDYVVVGGGSTGSVVAGRLGSAGYSVLVLEAGGPTQRSLGGFQSVQGRWTIFDVPLGWLQVLSDHRWSKEFQWNVPADPPPAIARGLGGCGIHNAMLYMRGRPEDFSQWGDGWSWSDVLPFYLRSENNSQFRASPYHGVGGPVQVSAVSSDAISRAFVEASVAAGQPRNADFNGDAREGAGFYQFMIRDGVRDSAAAAFIGLGVRPSSVRVRTHALVTRLLFGSDRRALGVEYVRGRNPTDASPRLRVRARREVVLCAGAIHTPKLLLLSGVGDEAQLRAHGITPLQHSPHVGLGLADGVYAIMQWETRGGDFERCRLDARDGSARNGGGGSGSSAYCLQQRASYLRGNASVFSSPGLSVGSFLRSPYAVGDEPDVQLTLHPWDKYGRTWKDSYGGIASLEIANNRPRSRGRVALRSARFNDPPIFDGPYLKDVNDSAPLRWAMRQVRRVVRTAPLDRHVRTELVPGEERRTDAQLLDAIACGPAQFRANSMEGCDRSELPVNHLAGTCRLAPSIRDGVVDLRLSVHGVGALRVADASVMPRPPSGNTHATCMMIGERAAAFMIEDARRADGLPPLQQPTATSR